MDSKTEKLLQSLKDKKVGVFCDNANLYHSYLKYEWRVDFGKFKEFISQHCNLQFTNYYLVIPAKNDIVYHGTQRFLNKIKLFVTIKSKDLKYTPVGGQVIKKGNMDVEIVLDVVRTIDNLDVVIIMSGDSDFLELKNYVIKDKNKNIIFWAFEKNMAWELKYCWHLYLNDYKEEFLKKFNITRYKLK